MGLKTAKSLLAGAASADIHKVNAIGKIVTQIRIGIRLLSSFSPVQESFQRSTSQKRDLEGL